LKPAKCEFNKTKVEYLGLIIEEGRIAMDTGKLKGIRDWPIPTTVKQVRGFLGFGNFYVYFTLPHRVHVEFMWSCGAYRLHVESIWSVTNVTHITKR
jgi:lysozyme family protein